MLLSPPVWLVCLKLMLLSQSWVYLNPPGELCAYTGYTWVYSLKTRVDECITVAATLISSRMFQPWILSKVYRHTLGLTDGCSPSTSIYNEPGEQKKTHHLYTCIQLQLYYLSHGCTFGCGLNLFAFWQLASQVHDLSILSGQPHARWWCTVLVVFIELCTPTIERLTSRQHMCLGLQVVDFEVAPTCLPKELNFLPWENFRSWILLRFAAVGIAVAHRPAQGLNISRRSVLSFDFTTGGQTASCRAWLSLRAASAREITLITSYYIYTSNIYNIITIA